MSDEELDAPGMGGDGDSIDDDGEMPEDELPEDELPEGDLPEGVLKEIITQGEGWNKPKTGDEVEVHYVGTLQSDGSQFDSSRDRDKIFQFTLGKGQVVKGWDVGVASMLKGEKAKFTLAPEFAYGESGSPPKIPANATLVFEVELIGWTSKDDLFGDDKCIKSVVEDTDQSWKKPNDQGEVLVSIKASAEDGTVLREETSIDYVIGSDAFGELSRVIDEALLGMAQNEKCSLACAKDFVFAGKGVVTVALHLQEIYSIVDVSFGKDKSVMKKTIVEGSGHEKPEDGSKVTLKVEAAVNGAGVAVPGFSAQDLSFDCCSGEVCDVLEHVVLGMKKNERALVTCTGHSVPKVAEAKLGIVGLQCDKVALTIELLAFEKGKSVWDLGNEEKMELALKRKAQGGTLFSAKRFELALGKYKKINDAVSNSDSFEGVLKAKAIEVKKLAELNKAACFLKLGDPAGALMACDKVLKDDRDNIKALFRRGQARHERRDHLDALTDLSRVIELDTSNKEAKLLLQRVKSAQKLVDKEAKAVYAKMCEGFGKLGAEERTNAAKAKSDADLDYGEDSEGEAGSDADGKPEEKATE